MLSLEHHPRGLSRSRGQTQSEKGEEIHFAHKEAEARAQMPGRMKTGLQQ